METIDTGVSNGTGEGNRGNEILLTFHEIRFIIIYRTSSRNCVNPVFATRFHYIRHKFSV